MKPFLRLWDSFMYKVPFQFLTGLIKTIVELTLDLHDYKMIDKYFQIYS